MKFKRITKQESWGKETSYKVIGSDATIVKAHRTNAQGWAICSRTFVLHHFNNWFDTLVEAKTACEDFGSIPTL